MDPDEITDETKILRRRPRKPNSETEAARDRSEPEPDFGGTRPTRPLADRGQRGDSGEVGEEDPTRPLQKRSVPGEDSTENDEDSPNTRLLHRPVRKSSKKSGPEVEQRESVEEGAEDPVVGFLVIVKGPGKGNFVRLGYGQNSLGRDKGRIQLNYGDKGISREKHCILSYDPRAREYVVRAGESDNFTYVNGDALHDPVRLKAGDIVELGDTHLHLVPFCGADFDWSELETEEE